MKITIIIPMYNAQNYIRQCIESAINQTVEKEIIIVDDGSTDSSYDIAMFYRAKNPEMIRVIQKKNGGTASAINVGILASDSDYVFWLSADDFLHDNDSLQRLLTKTEEFETTKTLFHSDGMIVDETSRDIGSFPKWNYNDASQLTQSVMMYHRFFANIETVLIPSHIFPDAGLFDEVIKYQEDYEFWLRLMLIHGYRFQKVDTMTVCYRHHDKMMTKNVSDSAIQSKRVRESVLSLLPESEQVSFLAYYSDMKPRPTTKERLRKLNAKLPSFISKRVSKTYQKFN
jgi:glycosyltransferase involved in cell wall biosynthesis